MLGDPSSDETLALDDPGEERPELRTEVLALEGELDGGRSYARRAAPLAIDPQELYGADAAAAQSVHTAFDALRAQVDLRTGVLAWNHVPGRLYVARDGRSETLEYDALIVCAGATDRLLPIAGWQHAGT